jgi:hypothetical protein
MQIYFKNSFVTLSYNRKKQLGIAEWTGTLQGPELREAFLLCLEMINRFSLIRWLADDRLMGPITPADLEWSLQVHVPGMAKSSLLRMAYLPSLSEENRETVEFMIDKGHTYDLKLVVRSFQEKEEAMAWLMEPL